MKTKFAICIGNKEYPASLEVRKIYRVLSDDKASRQGQLRVVDESGGDYLYPEGFFVPIKLPQAAEFSIWGWGVHPCFALKVTSSLPDESGDPI